MTKVEESSVGNEEVLQVRNASEEVLHVTVKARDTLLLRVVASLSTTIPRRALWRDAFP
jgi:hypothetical protein